jgi:DNA ligase 1
MEYRELAQIYDQLEKTSKRLEKTFIISELLKKTSIDDADMIVLLLQGRVFPSYDSSKLGIATNLVMKAISKSTGISIQKIEEKWKETGDLGKVAEVFVENKKQATLFSTELSVKKVFENLRKLPMIEGAGSVDKKLAVVSELLTNATPLEARYVVRTVLEDLRVGVGDGSLRDAIVWAYFGDRLNIVFNKKKKAIEVENRDEFNKVVKTTQAALDVTNDFQLVLRTAKEKGLKGLKQTKLIVGNPIKVMLAPKVADVEEGFERVGKPCLCEYKYDGFRMQIHKNADEIKIFTRRLENVTNQFPLVIDYVKSNVIGNSFVLEGEAVGFDPNSGKYLPFQSISQRIKRKHDIMRMAKELPVELNLFDIVFYEGDSLIDKPTEYRRELLEKIVKPAKKRIVLSRKLVSGDKKEVEEFYRNALDNAQEGLMLKSLSSTYRPGARVGNWVKLKPAMESLDLVIVGAEWGDGKRSGWLTSYTLACMGKDGELLKIGKSSTGLKEKPEEGLSFQEMTEILKPDILKEKGKSVVLKPSIVIEVQYQEIQKSPTYESGYALRFPSVSKLRTDRGLTDASTIEEIEELYKAQKK